MSRFQHFRIFWLVFFLVFSIKILLNSILSTDLFTYFSYLFLNTKLLFFLNFCKKNILRIYKVSVLQYKMSMQGAYFQLEGDYGGDRERLAGVVMHIMVIRVKAQRLAVTLLACPVTSSSSVFNALPTPPLRRLGGRFRRAACAASLLACHGGTERTGTG